MTSRQHNNDEMQKMFSSDNESWKFSQCSNETFAAIAIRAWSRCNTKKNENSGNQDPKNVIKMLKTKNECLMNERRRRRENLMMTIDSGAGSSGGDFGAGYGLFDGSWREKLDRVRLVD